MFGVDVVVSNHSNETLLRCRRAGCFSPITGSAPRTRTCDIVDGVCTLLSHPLYPESASTERMTIEAPKTPGSYVLRVRLVQESVFWFDELTPPVASWLMVEVADDTVGDAAESPTITLSGLSATLVDSLSVVRVARDGTFSDLGFADDQSDRMLTFAGSASFVNRAIAQPCRELHRHDQRTGGSDPIELRRADRDQPEGGVLPPAQWIANSTNFFADNRPTTVAASATVHPSAWIDPRGVSVGNTASSAQCRHQRPGDYGSETRSTRRRHGSAAFQTSERTGAYVELEHVGRVEIGTNCHIFSNASIARGVFRAATISVTGVRSVTAPSCPTNANSAATCSSVTTQR